MSFSMMEGGRLFNSPPLSATSLRLLALVVFLVSLRPSSCDGSAEACDDPVPSASLLLQVSSSKQGKVTEDTGGAVKSSRWDHLPFYDLLVIIPAHASRDKDRRDTIRKTWGQLIDSRGHCQSCDSNRTVKLVFAVGNEGNATEVDQEAALHGDMGVLKNFGQTQYYNSRPEKTRLSIRFALEHFRFRLLLKTDTDAWVFMKRLLRFAEVNHAFRDVADQRPGIYAGNSREGTHAAPYLEDDARWRDLVFTKKTGHHYYPTHAKGPGYMLTPDLCAFIAAGEGAAAETEGSPSWARMPSMVTDLPSEDVSVGFWLEAVSHTKLPMPVDLSAVGCGGRAVIDHYVDAGRMLGRWRSFLATGDPCNAEQAERRKGGR